MKGLCVKPVKHTLVKHWRSAQQFYVSARLIIMKDKHHHLTRNGVLL